MHSSYVLGIKTNPDVVLLLLGEVIVNNFLRGWRGELFSVKKKRKKVQQIAEPPLDPTPVGKTKFIFGPKPKLIHFIILQ